MMKAVVLLLALAAVVLGDVQVKVVETAQDAIPISPVDPEEISIVGYLVNEAIPAAEARKKLEAEYMKTDAARIINGQPAELGQFPWQSGLVISIIGFEDSNGICGASLISFNRLLTAAHCWFDGLHQAWRTRVILGSVLLFGTDGIRQETSLVHMHPEWTPTLLRNDIAIIYLPSPVPYNQFIAPINLPSGAELNENFAGEVAIASGFGLTADNANISLDQVLSFVPMPVISNSVCFWSFPIILQESNICISGSNGSPCRGDSGGPLYITRNNRPIQIGVVSFGRNTCQGGHPAVFARVTSFMDFIQAHL